MQSVKIGMEVLAMLGVIYMVPLTLIPALELLSRNVQIIIGQSTLPSAIKKVRMSINTSNIAIQAI